ncbi:MAG: chorismate synthase [Christensenellaceae bacterium]|nr:chorismate synthase [Christensenellaceae bacterium]
MSFEYGSKVKVAIFGQSHSPAIGVVIDGIPAGEAVDMRTIQAFMQRRAPGQSAYSTKRSEADEATILSGIVGGVTCGAPIAAVIQNTDARPGDYAGFMNTPRPSHADYPALAKHGAAHDIRGGGYFSGRMTAPLCFAGALAEQILNRKGIFVGAHIASIGLVQDEGFDPVHVSKEELLSTKNKTFPVRIDAQGEKMKLEIAAAAAEGDSIGGTVECCVVGLAAGMGEPIFDGLENKLAQAVFAIPAVKGIEFGSGFAGCALRGSQNNDAYHILDGAVRTQTNNSGGILGGLSTGMPVLFRAAFKPTPSIARKQRTIDLATGQDTVISIKGRHDPCIVPRAVPCVEAAALLAILDLL